MPVPADPSSPIPAALAQLAHAHPLQDSKPPHLLAYLASVLDLRAARGRRHLLACILGLAAAAVLAGARFIRAGGRSGATRALVRDGDTSPFVAT
jgi:hypothetical protein